MQATDFMQMAYEDRYQPKVSTGKILKVVAEMTGIPIQLIMGERKTATIALARHIAYWLMRKAGHTYVHIGEVMKRDHHTVIHGRKRIDGILAQNNDTANLIHQIATELKLEEDDGC